MPRLSKRCTVVCLALSVPVWMIFAALYLTTHGFMRRFELENKELIDFRVIVLTFSRSASLLKALRSIDAMELDGDKAILEIWIDRGKSGLVDNRTVQVAQSFNWTRGPTRVHIQKSHAGICGQWIDSWRPTSDTELAVIVEDDISLSKYAYRWIKAVHGFYGKREDFAGTTLTSDEVRSHHVSPIVLLKAPKNETVFMYSGVGSWGFSPKLAVWNRFQVWYHTQVNNTKFHPYIEGIRPTQWYKAMEKSGTSNSVWTQWFIYFTNMEKLFTIYNNLPTYVGDRNSCLSINRREVGLHTRRKGREDLCRLLDRWDERFVQFSENITKFDWAGKKVGQIDSHGTKTSEPIKAKSSDVNKLDGAGKKVGQIDSHGIKTSEPIKAKSSDVNKLGGEGKKVNETVICMIFTTPEKWYSRGVAVQNTWSRRCPRSVFFYSKSSAQCPKHAICNVSNAVGLDVPEGRDHLTGKTMEALKYCYKTFGRSVNWYLKADDDVYIFFENLLEVLSWYNSSSPRYIGHTILSNIPKGYQSGGAGYVLSRAAVAKMFENSTLFKRYCKGDGATEDLDIGSCLAGFGVYPEDVRDAEGRLRFHSQNPLRVLRGESLSDRRFIDFRGATFGNKKKKEKFEMLGRHTTSFHYVTPGEMYFIEFLAYDLRQQ